MTTSLPQGFQTAALATGIKPSGKLDLTAVVSRTPCVWAFAGTRSAAAAACVTRARQLYDAGLPLRAILVNSGVANAATGEGGATDNTEMSELLAGALDITPESVLSASTGIIGHRLPMDKVRSGVPKLASEVQGDVDIHAQAIMTTDTRPKIAERTLSGGQRIVGVAKGSGMIHPDMATMFSFVYSDAAIDQAALRAAFPAIVARTFNAVTVDGDTSTNDMAAVLCNAEAGAADTAEFLATLEEVMRDLAREIARDGEGATTLLTVKVTGAGTEADALLAARTCAGSALLKSAVHGRDPNWGRVIAALGRSGARLNLDNLRVGVQGVPVFHAQPLQYDAVAVSKAMNAEEVVFEIDLAVGQSKGEAWGCDLSADYVRINADYTT
ncbi:bifunctional glutamate N-acetyltransferase/amino-acid acetyltransferase ArgJ [Deinococcus detaillensis]|uniref:Arginine biosynthesis bifunctional protein ArgJ n=1 Tax=Deinococcus detaillensis TaxID=2592048 RepID=A0A553V5P3_9DEIO|nr:bifunctional glutamate N-acetyltransferase/amino-acid acetyltransferase ArgJ [Deinococcus detaillensis]TSA87779.1 bifunctional glutamate N-acetyltransferase/amino-acid acetyltransferase ArgJ [Deinococcus detaillensis]